MNRLDYYYRGLLEYRALVDKKRSCVTDRHSAAVASQKSDKIHLLRKRCVIDTVWVDEIERGLVFVDKAIKEERQFIRSNGEVIPIEKVKSVSKSSVEHLARHSNLITREHEGGDIVPDKLYTVEKLSDYAVYENRFLYMLLCYLRDFITMRYNNILDISNTYRGSMQMDKVIKSEHGEIKYKVELEEIKRDDEYLKTHNSEWQTIDRIDLLLKTVLAFLATPLMDMVSKSPMLKPPITRTNVLKMNNNFRGAMELYAFVTSYTEDGYTVVDEEKNLGPFDEALADDMANTITLSAFITYEYALDMKGELAAEYKAEEKRRREESFERQRAKIEELRAKLVAREISAEEYIIELEDAISAYEGKMRELAKTKKKLAECNAQLEDANRALDEAAAREAAFDERLEAEQERHESELGEVRAECEANLESMATEYDERLLAETAPLKNEIAKHAQSISTLENTISSERHSHRETLEAERREHTKSLGEVKHELLQMKNECDTLTEQKRLIAARLYGKTGENAYGEIVSHDTEESFDELERTFRAFKKYYKEQWTLAKKRIRRDLLKRKKADRSEGPITEPASSLNEQVADEAEKIVVNSEPVFEESLINKETELDTVLVSQQLVNSDDNRPKDNDDGNNPID